MWKKVFKGVGVAGIVGISYFVGRVTQNKGENENPLESQEVVLAHKRLNTYYDIMTNWMSHVQEGKYIGEYLLKKGVKKIAIYGHGKVGILLYNELKKSKVEVLCFTDEMTKEEFLGIDSVPNILIEDIAKQSIDAVVVTPCFAIEEIERVLRNIGFKKDIISLHELVYEM